MKLFKIIFSFFAFCFFSFKSIAQANPYIQVLPSNSGVVSLGGTLNLQITVGNTGTAGIIASKLRPVITVPALVNFLPDAQQTGLPAGWVIVSNTGSQLRICNGSDVISGNTTRTIILKVQSVTIGGPSTFTGQMNFGGATCAVSGPAPSGNNTADDFATSTIQVVAGCNLTVTATAGTILCNAGTTTITATTTNAVGAVEYSLTRITGPSAFQSSNIFLNEPAGTYSVTAREVANPSTCIAITPTIIIDDPAAILAPVVSIVQPSCTISNGVVSITSPTSGLTFSVDGNAAFVNYTGAISLAAGTHTIRAKNNNNCVSPITTFTINTQPITPAVPVISTITQPNCSVSTGSVVLNGLPTGNWIINPGAIAGNTTTTTINLLAAGVYNFTVTNALGCTSLSSTNVNINAVVGAPALPTIFVTQPTCTLSTGGIAITSSTSGLAFSLDGGPYNTYPIGGFVGIPSGNHTIIAQNVSGCLSPISNFTINTQPSSALAAIVNVVQPTCTVATGIITVTSPTLGLTYSFDAGPFVAYPVGGYITTAGTHSLAVQNNNGCTPTVTNNIIVNAQPTSPSIAASSSTITCFGSNSTITVSGTGGTLPYTYGLNNGTFQIANTFTVSAGTYNLTVKDVNGCTGNINNFIVTQPNAIAVSATTGSIACSGGNTTLTVMATGGNGTFEYKLNNGTFQQSNVFNVVAGGYTITARLIANPTCLATSSTIINITQPDSLKASATAFAINQCGGNTEVKITATGGKMPYTGTGLFKRGPGKWNFVITDANGCTTTSEIKILPPGCVDVKVFPNPAQNSITINHSAASADASLQIFSSNGALVLKKAVPQNAFISTIDISKLASAIYVLVYTNGKDSNETKFIKSNIK